MMLRISILLKMKRMAKMILWNRTNSSVAAAFFLLFFFFFFVYIVNSLCLLNLLLYIYTQYFLLGSDAHFV
jgi:hypothetical protein